MPAELSLYQVLFGCMGVYPNRHLIASNGSEAQAVNNFLNSGGRVCLESSSAFYIDVAYYSGHNFGPFFGVSATTYSYGDLGPLNGQSGTFTNTMYFNYGGENAYMDHLNPNGGYVIFRDVNNNYYCGIARSTATYRTVGLSFELGLLADGSPPSTREALLDSIMHFFGVPSPGVAEYRTEKQVSIMLEVYPNPFTEMTCIKYSIGQGAKGIELKIYDISGRVVKSFMVPSSYFLVPGEVTWTGRDNQDKLVASGIYFIELIVDDVCEVKKVMLIR